MKYTLHICGTLDKGTKVVVQVAMADTSRHSSGTRDAQEEVRNYSSWEGVNQRVRILLTQIVNSKTRNALKILCSSIQSENYAR